MTSDGRGREGVKPNLTISDQGERGGVMPNLRSDVANLSKPFFSPPSAI